MLRNLLILGLTLLCLALLFYPFGNQETLPPTTRSGDTAPNSELDELYNRITALESDLDAALLAHQQLEKRIQLLESNQVATVSAAITEDQPAAVSEPVAADTFAAEPAAAESPDVEQNLLAAGFSSTLINQIRQRVDDNRLQRLQWRDRAVREGWQQSEEFAERMFELSDPLRGIREEFGDEVYDQYLHASGQPNRVRVVEVLQGSAAQMAGISAGDVVISYANQTIYTMRSIRQATTEGAPGDPVLVELQRGISMESARIEP